MRGYNPHKPGRLSHNSCSCLDSRTYESNENKRRKKKPRRQWAGQYISGCYDSELCGFDNRAHMPVLPLQAYDPVAAQCL